MPRVARNSRRFILGGHLKGHRNAGDAVCRLDRRADVRSGQTATTIIRVLCLLPPTADIVSDTLMAGKRATSEHCGLVDHLISACQHCGWDCEADGLCSGQVDDKIELDWLFDWNVTGLSTVQDLINNFGGAAEQIREIRSVGN